MFVGAEVSLGVSFAAARARLAGLARGGLLASASAQAYRDGIAGLARAGLEGLAAGLPGVVHVHSRDLTASGGAARLALRWEVTGPGGESFPALDADLTLAPGAGHSATLTLAGAYRQPRGAAADRAVLGQVATATIRAFLHRIAEAIAQPPATAGPQAAAADPGPVWLPEAVMAWPAPADRAGKARAQVMRSAIAV